MTNQPHKAILWSPLEEGAVQCNLCNFHCRIADGQLGRCRTRRNDAGALHTLTYTALCSSAVDPIEKKPLFHFQPGRRSFSIATPGCNFQCDFCQNWQISQLPRQRPDFTGQPHTPDQIVAAAARNRCTSIAYTYTEPTIFMELAADTGRLAHQQNIANVFVSNGYMTIEALDYALDFLDAANIDLKAFTEDFYHNYCKAQLAPVLATLRHIAQNTVIWLEVTTLLIPDLNDSDDELKQIAQFIADQLGPHTPWHISRFHPTYQRTGNPTTPAESLDRAYQIGRDAGLHYVYIGNFPTADRESTYCHKCNHLLIKRQGYQITQFNLINAACPNCNTPLPGKQLDPLSP